MANHPYPRHPNPVPDYSWNLGVCIVCHHTWIYQHPANGYDIITRICPDCVPKVAEGQARRRSA